MGVGIQGVAALIPAIAMGWWGHSLGGGWITLVMGSIGLFIGIILRQIITVLLLLGFVVAIIGWVIWVVVSL